ncbi:MAG TPA: MBL fold metallo-hydrolase [Gemmataceae bacterium]|jgi:beta-lactamase superfamily II metal-dependent hydrolase|nr:MBL fold metallo-hydrolase [Gemmataceae bacterium]
MRWLISSAVIVLLQGSALAADERGLEIYFIDTEGGAATLIVTPTGESVLIDSGNPGKRDAERIFKIATERAKLTQIDHHIITHWHLDHYGGVERLSALLPIRHYYHHGIPETLAEDPMNFPLLIRAFKQASAGKETRLKAGDTVPLKPVVNGPAFELFCLCGNGEVISDKPDAPANPIAADHKPQPVDKTDNAKSLGFLLKFGGFRFLDLGDLTWNIEYKLVYPSDKIGLVDLYQVTHHGLEISNNPVLVRTVQPRVAVCNNGPRKGGHPQVIATLRRLPEVPTIYQLHRNVTSEPSENTEPDFIANNDEQNCKAEPIIVMVAPDAKTYTVTVGGTNKTRKFETRNP